MLSINEKFLNTDVKYIVLPQVTFSKKHRMVLEGLLTSAHRVPTTQAQLKALITGRNITTKAYQERILRGGDKWAMTFKYYTHHTPEETGNSVRDPLFNRSKFD